MIEIFRNPLFSTEKTMLENAWFWLFQSSPPSQGTPEKSGRFYFFVLPLTLEFEGNFAQKFAHNRLSHIRFHCESLEIAFEIENLVLRDKFLNKD
jgi:hypothetical protein